MRPSPASSSAASLAGLATSLASMRGDSLVLVNTSGGADGRAPNSASSSAVASSARVFLATGTATGMATGAAGAGAALATRKRLPQLRQNVSLSSLLAPQFSQSTTAVTG